MKHSRCAALCLLIASALVCAAESEISVDLGGGVKLELVLIKAGTFTQGSPAGEAGRGNDENQREVTLNSDFYMGKFPVTRGQFARFAAESGYRTEAEKGASGGYGLVGKELVQRKDFTWKHLGFQQSDDHPVGMVTYDDALAFCKWLARKSGRTVNLPTEAQWEYACRAGTTTRFYSGDEDEKLSSIAWFKGNSGDGTRTVSGRNANAWNLYDMNGNVYEWCRDWYSPVYAPGPVNDPEEMRNNLSDKPRRVLRGGSFLKDAKACRSAARWRNDSRSRNADNGFRVMASVNVAPITAPVAPIVPPVVQPPSVESTQPPQVFVPPPQNFDKPIPHSSGGISMLGILAIILGVGFGGLIIAFIVYKIVSSMSGSRGPAFNNVQPRAVSDGFWLDGGVPRGSTVRYRYRSGGGWQEGTYTVIDPSPQGMFIYTGHQPSDIEILDVFSGSASTPRPAPQPTYTQSSSSSNFSGYPSAY